MTQSDWPARYTKVVATQIRRLRQDRRVSAQQLSDACSQWGLSISRSTLADLENGRRDSVSVAELLVISAALDVPPIMLMLPVLREQTVEILPERTMPTGRAAMWIRGDGALRRGDSDDALTVRILRPDQEPTAAALLEAHENEVAGWLFLHREIQSRPGDQEPNLWLLQNRQKTLAYIRSLIKSRGLLLPDLPADLRLVLQADGH